MTTRRKQKVFVGLSGGVDSSVAALRLLHEGYDVVGVFIKVWQPDFLVCNWEQERLDAMRVAAHLNIPFLTCDAADTYRREVGEFFIHEYLHGRVPNPDVMCNQHVKFGAFLDFARAHGADFIATGHYASVSRDGEIPRLLRGVDTLKDQSYFLWTLSPHVLTQVLLPIGASTKDVVRKEAQRYKLPTAIKKDSQGVCFLGHIDIPDFLSHFTTLTPGKVLSRDGSVIGVHRGALVYTYGQRHGFTIYEKNVTPRPYYVVAKDVTANTITVDHQPPTIAHQSTISLHSVSWTRETPDNGTYTAMFRYRQEPIPVTLTHTSAAEVMVQPLQSIETPAPGQSCVLFAGRECLGGGIIGA